MSKVLDVTINPDIELDEKQVEGMPHALKQHLLVTMTIMMQREKCDWRDLKWSVKYYNGQPVISVKKK